MSKLYALEAWMSACPADSPYEPCPCGCGKKFRYVVKGGNTALHEHYQNFVKNLVARHGDAVVDNNSYDPAGDPSESGIKR